MWIIYKKIKHTSYISVLFKHFNFVRESRTTRRNFAKKEKSKTKGAEEIKFLSSRICTMNIM